MRLLTATAPHEATTTGRTANGRGWIIPLTTMGLTLAGTVLVLWALNLDPKIAGGGPSIAGLVMLGIVVLVALAWIVTGQALTKGSDRDTAAGRLSNDTRVAERLVPASEVSGAGIGASFARLESVKAVVQHLLARTERQQGYRILVAGETPSIEVGGDAVAVAEGLNRAGRQVVVIGWSLEGRGLDGSTKCTGLGINDLLEDRATFEDIVARMPGSAVHVIVAGTPVRDLAAALDPERLNLVLDALDEVYQHIVVASGHGEARRLFEATEGRFDAAVAVSEGACHELTLMTAPNRYLGYDVADLEIVRLERSEGAAVGPGSRRCIQRTSRPAGKTQARPAMT